MPLEAFCLIVYTVYFGYRLNKISEPTMNRQYNLYPRFTCSSACSLPYMHNKLFLNRAGADLKNSKISHGLGSP